MCLLRAMVLTWPGKMRRMGMTASAVMMALATLRRQGTLRPLLSRQWGLQQVCLWAVGYLPKESEKSLSPSSMCMRAAGFAAGLADPEEEEGFGAFGEAAEVPPPAQQLAQSSGPDAAGQPAQAAPADGSTLLLTRLFAASKPEYQDLVSQRSFCTTMNDSDP